MKEIQLTRNQAALVDDEDYEELSKHKWYSAYRKDNQAYYAARKGPQKSLLMHRVIMNVTEPSIYVDHRNRDTLDNRKCNLRLCSGAQNQMNRPVQPNNTSGHRGVSWNKQNNKWHARINVSGKRIFLGYFTDLQNAADIYEKAAEKFFGEFKFKPVALHIEI